MAVFKNPPAAIGNQAIVFEVNSSSGIIAVEWLVDGKKINSIHSSPFSVSWKPVTGKHVITAKGITQTNQTIAADPVTITVED